MALPTSTSCRTFPRPRRVHAALAAAAALLVGGLVVTDAGAAPVTLQQGTARSTQGGFSPDQAVDGVFNYANDGGTGWAQGGSFENAATFETAADTTAGPATRLTFNLFSGGFGVHTLGKFRLSATTADRGLFADGNDQGGAGVGTEPVWTVLDPISLSATGESSQGVPATPPTLEEAAGNIVRVNGGGNPEYQTLTVTADTTLTGITGIRLEVFTDADTTVYPGGGPGRPGNGNFVLRELTVDAAAIPEPAALSLLALGGILALRRRRRRCPW
jgi:hypothetical protein